MVKKGSTNLKEIDDRVTTNKLTDEDKSILTLLKLSGLNLKEEVQKGNQPNRFRQYSR